MKNPRIAKANWFVSLFFLLILFAQPAVGAADGADIAKPPAGLSAAEAIHLGEAMYRKGVLPSGEPMTGFVQGDIEVKGGILTCANCHTRSGLGSYEGQVTTLPTNGAKLYAPLRSSGELPSTYMLRGRPLKAPRPAYTDEALAKALWHGVDPAGRVMSETMPRYVFTDRDMEIMIFYLKNLSSTYSPGASKEVLRLATVVSEGVSVEDRNSMLDPLKSFVQRFPLKLSLDVWELKGPQESWKEQLEKYYQQQPVFALLGGLVTGPWSPVHEFCEKNSIPNLFPITDLPVISDKDWYTFYFSKGYYQEGEAAAKYLAHGHERPPEKQVVQVFRENNEGKGLAQGFSDTWKKLGKTPLIDKTISTNETINADFWKNLAATHRDTVLLVWLGPKDLAGIESLAELQEKPSMVLASSTMLGEAFSSVPEKIRSFTYITYPYGLPEERESVRTASEQFFKSRGIHPANKAIAEKTFSLFHLFSFAVNGMRNDRYRDFFLDELDMMEDQTGYGVRYPRLSFGPGQRYASKGCYIVSLSEGPQPQLVRKSEWVIY